MAIYIIFILVSCVLIGIAIKGSEHQNKYFSIPAIAVKSRVYCFLAGAICMTIVGLALYFNISEEVSDQQPDVSSNNRQNVSTAASQERRSSGHEMKLYCCNSDTKAKVCEIDIALGTPGFPCYCVGTEGAGIICQ